MAAVGGVGHVLIPVPGHRGSGVVVAGAEVPVGRGVEVCCDRRIDQQLAGDAGRPRSRASSAVTAARLPPALSPATTMRAGSAPSSSACPADPVRDRIDIVDGGRPRRFRRQPVVDRHHDRADAIGHRATQVVVGVQVAEHEAAAMGEHDDRQRTGRCSGPIDSDAMSPAGPGTVRSITLPTGSGFCRSCARSRITARSCGAVIVSTRGKPRLSAGSSAAISGSRFTRIAARGPGSGAGLLQDWLHADLVAVVVVAPDAQRRRPHRSGQPVVEGHPVQRAADRDGGDRRVDVADRRSDTTESGD